MPEGDTLHRIANRVRPALVGRTLVRIEAPLATGTAKRPRPGTKITAVEAVGKHLLIHFDNGTILRTHLRMTGSWHLYRTGERWQKPAYLARAVVEVEDWVAVCFAAPTVVFEQEQTMTSLDHLGPDLTRPDVGEAELDAAVARMASIPEPGEQIAVVLLDQRVAAGIGNVYKSEVLWACGVDPFSPVSAVDSATRRRLLATASKLLRASVAGASVRTTQPNGLAVYGRSGQPCRRCGSPISARRQGEQARTTYWCPSCQPAIAP